MNLPSLVTNNDMNSKIISKKLFDRYSKEFVSSDTPSKVLNNDDKSKKKSNKLGDVPECQCFFVLRICTA